jgi:hypothetical protein
MPRHDKRTFGHITELGCLLYKVLHMQSVEVAWPHPSHEACKDETRRDLIAVQPTTQARIHGHASGSTVLTSWTLESRELRLAGCGGGRLCID